MYQILIDVEVIRRIEEEYLRQCEVRSLNGHPWVAVISSHPDSKKWNFIVEDDI